MSLDTVWVFAEAQDGKVKTITLEILAKAREIADTVVCFYGGDGDAWPPSWASTAARPSTPPATWATSWWACPWPPPWPRRSPRTARPTSSCWAPPTTAVTWPGGCRPRSSAPVITNIVDIEVDGDDVVGTEPVFGGTINVKTRFTGDGAKIVLVRPKSFAAEPLGGSAADVEDLEVPDAGRHRRGHDHRPPHRGGHRAEARGGGHRRLRRPRPGRGGQVRA